MARVLHLFKGDHAAQASTVIDAQLAAGDQVTIALLESAQAPALSDRVETHRVPAELPYDRLVDLIFAAESVITW